MKPKKPGKASTSDSEKKQSGADEDFKKKKPWFHDSSQTELEALRAMIGKQDIKEEDTEVEDPNESKT